MLQLDNILSATKQGAQLASAKFETKRDTQKQKYLADGYNYINLQATKRGLVAVITEQNADGTTTEHTITTTKSKDLCGLVAIYIENDKATLYENDKLQLKLAFSSSDKADELARDLYDNLSDKLAKLQATK